MEIHEKSTLGRPWGDFLSSGVDFGRGRKIYDFLIAPGRPKINKKLSLERPIGRLGCLKGHELSKLILPGGRPDATPDPS